MIEIVRGDTSMVEWQVTEAYDGDGNPLDDLSRVAFIAQARWAPDDPVVLFQKSTADGSIIVSGMTVLLRINPADTAGLPAPSVFVIDLQAQVGGSVATVRTPHGQPLRVVLRPDVTR